MQHQRNPGTIFLQLHIARDRDRDPHVEVVGVSKLSCALRDTKQIVAYDLETLTDLIANLVQGITHRAPPVSSRWR